MHEWLFLLSAPPPPLKDVAEDVGVGRELKETEEGGGGTRSGISEREGGY